MGKHMRGVAALAVAAMLLAGCAKLQEIPYDHASAGQIHSIGILTPRAPEHPSVILASTVGQSFGLVGALIDAGLQSSRESNFTAMLQQQSFSEQDCFVASLTEALQAQGYTVSMVPVVRDPKGGFLVKYPIGPDPQADAYLDLVIGFYGYIAAGVVGDTPYRPHFAVAVRLVNARDGSVLMQDAVFYNPIRNPSNAVTIAPDPALRYGTFDALMADPPGAITGLRLATEQSAQTVGKLLQ